MKTDNNNLQVALIDSQNDLDDNNKVTYEVIMTIDEYNTIYGAGAEPIIEDTYECVICYPQSDLDLEITGIPSTKNTKVYYTKIDDDDDDDNDKK